MIKKIISIIMILMLIAVPIVSQAATIDELNAQKAQLEKEKQEAAARQKEIERQINSTKSELDKLNDEIEAKEYEISITTAELNILNSQVEILKGQLEEAEKKYNERYDMLCKRLAAQYKRGSASYLDILLTSSSLADFISNYYIIGKIAELDTALLDDIEEQQRTITESKKEVEKKQSEVEDKKKQLDVEEKTLINKKANKNKYISQLSAEEQALQKDIDKFNSQIKQHDNEILEIVRQQAAANGGGNWDGGKLQWPVPSSKRITSYFGYRGSAATGGVGTANHNGYDIGANHYSDIVAAETGRVIKVVSGCTHDYPKTFATRCYCGGGYGNYLMIDHGNGLVTLYGHVSSIHVSVGQIVARGQKVASVGSCGWSTGYHLHFSVIHNGTYVNPGNYVNV